MTILDDARAGMNPDIRPQDDLFGHVNGRWLDETEIPADRSSWGPFVQLADAAEQHVKEIIEELAQAQGDDLDEDARKIGDLYASSAEHGGDPRNVYKVGLNTTRLLMALGDVTCAWLLLRSYARSRVRLLLWSGVCFAGLTVNNVLLFIDRILLPSTVDLGTWRLLAALVALLPLLYGLVWEDQ